MSHLHVPVETLITHETDLVEGQEQRPEIARPHTQNNTLHLREELSANESSVWRLKPELTVTSGVTSQVTWLITLSLRAADILFCLLCDAKGVLWSLGTVSQVVCKWPFDTVSDVYVPVHEMESSYVWTA